LPQRAIFEVQSDDELKGLQEGQMGVELITLAPDGKKALVSLYDKTLMVWDLEAGKEILSLEQDDCLPRT
jgi:WD40 repeat protein